MSANNRKTVLVVDDDTDLLALVAMILESEGYKVEEAADGRQGLQAIENNFPDLILLDMKMPVMNGWEFAKEFQAKYDSQAPIIVLTAAADARRLAGEIGAAGWVGKPFDIDSLLNTVRKEVTKQHP